MENELSNKIDFSQEMTVKLIKKVLEKEERPGVLLYQIQLLLNYNITKLRVIQSEELVKFIEDNKEEIITEAF